MLGARTRVALLLTLIIVVSGCVSGEGLSVESNPEGSTAASDAPVATDAPVGTDDPDRQVLTGSQGAVECTRPDSRVKFDESKNTTGGAHAHDEWGGVTEKVIFDADITHFGGGGWFEMPDAVVIPGTGKMEFKLTWAQLPAADPRTLAYDMPGDERTTANMYTIPFATSGQSASIEINISNNDPPHYEKTTWTFKIVESKTVRIKWTIFRTYDCLPIDPPHYDQWEGKTYRVFWTVKSTHDVKYVCPPGGVSQTGGGCSSSGAFYGHRPKENTTVPIGTERMVVTLSWVADPNYNQKLGLAVAPPTTNGGSTSATWSRVGKVKDLGGTSREFELTLGPDSWDSPYNSKTQWMFTFYIDNGSNFAALGDTGAFKGDIDWKVELYRAL